MLSLEMQDNIARKLGHAFDTCYSVRLMVEKAGKGYDPETYDNFAWDLLDVLDNAMNGMVDFLETYGKDVD
jgi:hypothetical protein